MIPVESPKHQLDEQSSLEPTADGWYVARCSCGEFTFGPVPGLVEVIDVLMEHAALATSDRIEELEQALHQHGHIVDIQETRFGLEHPIECRKDGLLNCPLDAVLTAQPGPPRPPGRYPVALEKGALVFGDPL